jgi:putative ABC transport system permease protein
MPLLSRISSFLRNLFHMTHVEQDLDEEARSYLEMLADENVKAGKTPEDARRAALIEFGGLDQVKEQVRDARVGVFLETIWLDLRNATRTLAKSPGFTAVAVLTLALGIGANTAIFSVVSAVLLRPLPLKDPDRLIQLARRYVYKGQIIGSNTGISVPLSAYWIKENRVFEHMAGYDFSGPGFNLAGGSEPERLRGIRVTANFFRLVGVNPVLGRNFLPEEDYPGAERVVILSHELWQQRFGANRDLLGKPLTLSGETYTVIGVMPTFFQFSEQADLWTLLRGVPNSQDLANQLHVVGRLKPDISMESARLEMDRVARQVRQEYPTWVGKYETVGLIPLREQLVGEVEPALLLLLGSVGLVLLIACANVANLLLARATARKREMGVRMALGASRLRLIRQLLTESALLSLMGGALGLLLGAWGLEVLLAIEPGNIPRLGEIGINGRVLGFTLAVSLLTGIIFGLAPAFEASKSDLNEALQEGTSRTTVGLRRRRARNLLVVSEISLALVLLIGATLLMESFRRLRSVKPGIDPGHVLTLEMSVTESKYATTPQVANFYRQVLQRIEALPGVETAAAVSGLPLDQTLSWNFDIEGRSRGGKGQWRAITPSYFKVMRIPLVQGRYFTEGDAEKASAVVIINETLARQQWPSEDPIGQHLTMSMGPERVDVPRQIVGIVGDVMLSLLDKSVSPELFVPCAQVPSKMMVFMNQIQPPNWVVRTDLDPLSLGEAVKREIQRVDRQQPVFNIRSMEQVVSTLIAPQNFNTLLMGVFAAIALVLASVGIYGVMSYSVQQRTHEIGIRIALGAQKDDVVRLVVGEGMLLALVGVAIGLAASLALTRVLSSLLFGVSARDPMILAGVSILLVSVALLACYIPARRATKVDPMVALRCE